MKRNTTWIAVLVAIFAVAGCKKKEPAPADPPAGSATGAGSGTAMAGSGAAAGSAAGSAAATPKPLGEGLSTPESALWDEAQDRYLVSNINGAPAEADDNGFIAAIAPDGSTTTKWIDGAKDDVKLDAPKGMAISGDVLWVADITQVRRFDARTGAQQPDVKIEGATFLNGVASDGAGGVFVTDSGLDASFQPTGTDAVYHLGKDGVVTPRLKDKELGGPNGIAAGKDGAVWVVTFGSGEVYELDAKGGKNKAEKLPNGQLDGIIALEGGDLLVSSWEGKAVYRGTPGGEWKEVVSGVVSPADIGWDAKRKQVLVPSFEGNSLTAHPIE